MWTEAQLMQCSVSMCYLKRCSQAFLFFFTFGQAIAVSPSCLVFMLSYAHCLFSPFP